MARIKAAGLIFLLYVSSCVSDHEPGHVEAGPENAESYPAPIPPKTPAKGHNEEDPDIKFIKVAIARSPITSFTAYPALGQLVEADETIYKLLIGEKKLGRVIFRKKGNDLHSSTVILSEKEDGLDYTNEDEDNRIYVVLIQNPVEGNIYHAVYAYARNVPPGEANDDSVININREKRRIEWDVWDERGSRRNKASAFGWTSCTESFFVPCKKNFRHHDDESPLENYHRLPSKNSERIEFKTESGLDAGENFDFFGDLDDDDHQAAFVGAVTDTITDTVQFFADAIYDNKRGNFSDVDGATALADSANKNFVNAVQTDLKTIGFYSFPSDGKIRSPESHLAEGYRVLAGILNNSESDRIPERLTIHVFAADKKNQSESQSSDPSGRGVIVITSSNASSAASSSSSSSTSSSKKITVTKSVGKREIREKRQGLGGLFKGIFGGKGGGQSSQKVVGGEHFQGLIPGKVGGTINGEDWRTFCARPGLSQGDQTWCGCHKGKDASFGLSEDVGDSLSKLLNGNTINDNPSALEDVFNSLAPAVFCGTTGKAIDLFNSVIGKTLGIDKLVGTIGKGAAAIASIPGGYPIWLAHLIHQGVKVIGQTAGIGDIIGMKGKQGGILSSLGGKGRGVQGIEKPEPRPEVQTDVEIFSHIGWRTQDVDDINEIPLNKFSHQFSTEAFIGLGVCPYEPVTIEDIVHSEFLIDVAEHYHKLLRTQCIHKQRVTLNDMVEEGHFVLNKDKTISVVQNLPILKKTILSQREVIRLSLGFNIAIFTQAYMDEVRKPSDYPQNPKNEPISRPVQVIVNFALSSIGEFRRSAPVHFIKLTRDLTQTVKTVFSMSLQDFYRFKECSACSLKHKTEAKNDALTLLGILQFIIEGLGPIETYGSSIQDTWDSFFKRNHHLLQSKLELYVQHT